MHFHLNLPGAWRSWLRLAGDVPVRRPMEGIAAVAAGLRQAVMPLARAAVTATTKELSHQERARVDHGAALIASSVRALAVPLLLGALLLAWCRPIVFCVLAAALLCVTV